MVKRKVAQNRHGYGETKGPTKSGAAMLSPKTPGWKAANASMFAEPLPTPKSQVNTGRLTRRASLYQAEGRNLLGGSPVGSRSRNSVILKRLQTPKKSIHSPKNRMNSPKRSRKTSRAQERAIAESLEEIEERPATIKVTKSKTITTRSRRHGSDISVDVNIRMPSLKKMQAKRSAKQSHSEPVFMSSSGSTVAESEMSEEPIKKSKLPRRKSSKARERSPDWNDTDDDVAAASFASSAASLAQKETTPKQSPEKSKAKSQPRKTKPSQASKSKSGTSLYSLDSEDMGLPEPGKRAKKNAESPLRSVSDTDSVGTTYSLPDESSIKSPRLRSVSSRESIATTYSLPPLSQGKRKTKSDESKKSPKPRSVPSAESIDITYSTPLASSPNKRKSKAEQTNKRSPKLHSVSSAESVESSPEQKQTKAKTPKPRKGSQEDQKKTETYKTPIADLKDWSPFKKLRQTPGLHDVSQQASFTTPDDKLERTASKASKRGGRDTPMKAVKVLGKNTPTSKRIKRSKTPGRLTPGRKASNQSNASTSVLYVTRKRRNSSTHFSELPSRKRPRGKDRGPPSWYETWCTIL